MEEKLIRELLKDTFSVIPVFTKTLLNVADKFLKDKGICGAHIKVIYSLKKYDQINITDLSKTLSASKSNVTGWIDKLVELGLVERVFDQNDRRRTYVRLTNDGLVFFNSCEEALKEAFMEKLCRLEEEDLRLFKETLDNMKVLIKKIK